MSYILDALRRADAERQRGGVPGLHAQPTANVMPGATRGTATARSTWALAVGAAALLAGAALAWRAWQAPPMPKFAAPIAQIATPAAPATTVVPWPTATTTPPPTPGLTINAPWPASKTDAPTPVATSSARLTAREEGRIVAALPPVANASIAAPDSTIAAPPRGAAPTTLPKRAAIATTSGSPPAAAEAPPVPIDSADSTATKPAAARTVPPHSPAATPDARVYAIAELPEDIRRELPNLQIGGSAYSENPASRFVIVNGQLFHEGDVLASGLTLRQIKLRSVVVEFRGYRYSTGF